MGQKQEVMYFNPNQERKAEGLRNQLYQGICDLKKREQMLVFLCIGTDRATGDCLGPLVGYKLAQRKCGLQQSEQDAKRTYGLMGTLEHPIHAGNLDYVTSMLRQKYGNPFVVAVDACLGQKNHIGLVTLSRKGLLPGQGVNKNMPMVGDISVTGIVNCSSRVGLHAIQSTRLSVVMEMADYISNEIECVVNDIFSNDSCMAL